MKTEFILFSELYNCYYQVVSQILSQAQKQPLTAKQMTMIANIHGYQESALSIIPNLLHGTWPFLEKDKESANQYRSRILHCGDSFPMPLTNLQKSWLKALLFDSRIRLFFTDEQLSLLEKALAHTKPLFRFHDFSYFDQYKDHDLFSSVTYRAHFQKILAAIEEKSLLNLSYLSGQKHIITGTWLPCRLEYGQKEGKFRLYGIRKRKGNRSYMEVLNVGRILKIEDTGQRETEDISIDAFLDKALCREPLILEITNQRNALERAMLHFSCYQKKIERLDTSGKYLCSIYYDKRWETELLIQVLSFGPVIKVLGPESFLHQVVERVKKQAAMTNITEQRTYRCQEQAPRFPLPKPQASAQAENCPRPEPEDSRSES